MFDPEISTPYTGRPQYPWNVLIVEEAGFNLFVTFYLFLETRYVYTSAFLDIRQLELSKCDVITLQRDEMYELCLRHI